jgi:RHS repeat-associated protein
MTTYLHDFWNVIHEPATTVETTTNPADNSTITTTTLSTKSYIWGLDLSNTLQSAGGVGGLLTTRHTPNSQLPTQNSLYHHTYDANGNTSELFDAAGAATAHYEYDAFGATIFYIGQYDPNSLFQFGTKQRDVITSLYYFGYRFYDSSCGKWINRDPIGEVSEKGLYNVMRNNLITNNDILGLMTCPIEDTDIPSAKAVEDNLKKEISSFSLGFKLELPLFKIGIGSTLGQTSKFVKATCQKIVDIKHPCKPTFWSRLPFTKTVCECSREYEFSCYVDIDVYRTIVIKIGGEAGVKLGEEEYKFTVGGIEYIVKDRYVGRRSISKDIGDEITRGCK